MSKLCLKMHQIASQRIFISNKTKLNAGLALRLRADFIIGQYYISANKIILPQGQNYTEKICFNGS